MRTRLERVLSIFSLASESFKEYLLNYDLPLEDELQKKIADRLRYAASDSEMRKKMDLEQDILTELQNMERQLNAKDKALEEKDKALEEKDKALEEKDKLIQELLKKLGNTEK